MASDITGEPPIAPGIIPNSSTQPAGGTARVLAIHYSTGRPISVEIADGVIRQVGEISAEDSPAGDLPIIAPGLVDLQINGFAGHDFNQLPVGPQMVRDVVRLLWREGVTSFYPTIITNSADVISDAMSAIAGACRQDADVAGAVAGIHLEGPFISPQDGARGAHALQHVLPADWDLFRRWQDAAGGRIRILTMSPEWAGSAEFIARCVGAGVTVSIGHTSATPAQIGEAVKAGARLSTHLGNAAHLMLPRHPNYLWEQLAQDELWATLIADGFHLPDQVLKVVMKVKGERAMLVSDAVSLAGLPPGEYATPVGGRVVLTPAGKLHLASNDKLLAGSAQMLLKGIDHLVSRGLAEFATAWEMASTRPAAFMNLPAAAGLTPGVLADFVLMRRGIAGIELRATYKAGTRVYESSDD